MNNESLEYHTAAKKLGLKILKYESSTDCNKADAFLKIKHSASVTEWFSKKLPHDYTSIT